MLCLQRRWLWDMDLWDLTARASCSWSSALTCWLAEVLKDVQLTSHSLSQRPWFTPVRPQLWTDSSPECVGCNPSYSATSWISAKYCWHIHGDWGGSHHHYTPQVLVGTTSLKLPSRKTELHHGPAWAEIPAHPRAVPGNTQNPNGIKPLTLAGLHEINEAMASHEADQGKQDQCKQPNPLLKEQRTKHSALFYFC
jgi:hypothetical protein